MKTSPIVLKAQAVLAILAGSKTQHGVIVAPQPETFIDNASGEMMFRVWQSAGDRSLSMSDFIAEFSPFGKPGDRLWVRESWQALKEFDATGANDIPRDVRHRINYLADGDLWDAKLRPSNQMPRWACRLYLEITEVKIRRLHDYLEADAIAEGVRQATDGSQKWIGSEGPGRTVISWPTPMEAFQDLWCANNGPDSFAENPWVWDRQFRQVPQSEANSEMNMNDKAAA